VERLRKHLRESFRALAEVFRNPSLRRLELAWAGSIIGSWAYTVALVVYAYRHGGATAVGLVGLIRWLPAAAASPLAALLGDRYRRVPVMLGADVLRACALAAMAICVLTHAPVVAVYALASAVAVTTTAFQPAQAALLPSLARTPEELTAAVAGAPRFVLLDLTAGLDHDAILGAAERADVPVLAFTTHALARQTAPWHARCGRVVTKETLTAELPALLRDGVTNVEGRGA